jgi:hypothetical protein
VRTTTVPAGLRVLVVVGLAGAWCIGFLAQRAVVEETEYLDIPPALLVLGIAQCVAAGAASYVLAPAHRVVRTGVLAGLAMAALMVGGYLLLALAYADRFAGEESGETWLSLLFESWFWIGLPALSSAALGAIGWLGAATLHRRSHQGRRHHAHA